MQQPIIEPIDTSLIENELTADRYLRSTNKGGNEIYIVDAFNAPNTMLEIGRLREIAFRTAGGGTGKDCDIDYYDTMTPACQQLIVWNPEQKQIIGGYRFILGSDIVINDDVPRIATAHMFDFSTKFLSDYLPSTIELGRSFVRLECQSTRAGVNAIYALDNLWDGLGALTVKYPHVKYLFGKVTMYPNYSKHCRNLILYFLHKYFPDNDRLVWPKAPAVTAADIQNIAQIFTGENFKEDYRILNTEVRNQGYNIPPLFNAYMSLSPTMRIFGTAVNDEFGDVEETGIFLTIEEIFEEKKQRHISTFKG